jgi:DNA-binding HxlR family transcriptional regulator
MTDSCGLSEKFRRGAVLSARCPSRAILNHVTGRWAVLVLIVLAQGKHRFAEIRRRIDGVSDRMLAQTLQQLEGDRLVIRTAHPVVPPHVDYELSPQGRELAPLLIGLVDWIETNIGDLVRQQPEPA